MLKKWIRRSADKGSWAIEDQTIVDNFTSVPENTYLVSFPRTGSHWLRMLMELYFEQPSLVRIFYYPEKKNYLALHTHDLELSVKRLNVIYLYRHPVETVYSQLRYERDDIENREKIAYWADLYGRHLDKWLHQEDFTTKKTCLRYEGLKSEPAREFAKVCAHFGMKFDLHKLDEAAVRVSKKEVKSKTDHDPNVTNLSKEYTSTRKRFQERQGGYVWKILLAGRDHLKEDFDNE
ncbi:sulfotransferase domain-containing protein [Acidobacteriota bacterium]